MARSVLDIVIRTLKQGGADKEVVAGLAGVKNALSQAGMIAGTFVAAYYTVDKVLDATVGTFVNYAAQVRELSRLTGTSAEDTSRLIQMADDLTISYESLQKSLWAASKNGFDVNVQSLAKMADQYVAIQSPSERAEFLAKRFGKSGAEMGKLLEQGATGVIAANDAISGNLVLTEDAIAAAREYEIATDNLSDAWEGFKVAIGRDLAPILTQTINGMNQVAKANDQYNERLQKTISLYGNHGDRANNMRILMSLEEEKVNSATNSYAAMAKAIESSATASNNFSDAVAEIDYGSLLDTTLALQDGFDGFAEKAAEIEEKIAALDPASEDYAATLSDLKGELNANAAAQELWAKKLVFSMAQAKLAVGGIDSGEFNFLIELGAQMGLVDRKTATMATNLNSAMDNIDFSNVTNFSGAWRALMALPSNKRFDVETWIRYYTDNGGGSCFTAETPVSTMRGFVPIGVLMTGDMVKVLSEQGSVVEAMIHRTFESERDDLVEVKTSDGQDFRCSPNHRWRLYNGNWKEAAALQAGDCLTSDHGAVRVLSVMPFAGTHKVYNLTIAHPDHTYCVGGLVVHNIKTEGMIGPQATPFMGAVSNVSTQSSTVNQNNASRTINIYNPVFQVGNASGVVDVLDALS